MLRESKRRTLCWSFGNPTSLRFEHDPDAVDDVIKEAEEAEAKRQAEVAKAKQLAEQEAANARKAREQAQAAQQRIAELEAENEANRKQLTEMQTKAQGQGIEIPDLNEEEYSDSDIPLVKAIKALNAKINAKDTQLAALEKRNADAEAKAQQDAAKRQQEAAYNSLLDELDEDYGAQHRNAAVRKFNELVEEGKVPKDATKATRILEKCYKEVVAASKSNKGSDTTLDTGTGGGSPSIHRTKLKAGSLAEVEAQLAGQT